MALLWCNGLIFLGYSHVANALLRFSKAPCFVPAESFVPVLSPKVQPCSTFKDAL